MSLRLVTFLFISFTTSRIVSLLHLPGVKWWQKNVTRVLYEPISKRMGPDKFGQAWLVADFPFLHFCRIGAAKMVSSRPYFQQRGIKDVCYTVFSKSLSIRLLSCTCGTDIRTINMQSKIYMVWLVPLWLSTAWEKKLLLWTELLERGLYTADTIHRLSHYFLTCTLLSVSCELVLKLALSWV